MNFDRKKLKQSVRTKMKESINAPWETAVVLSLIQLALTLVVIIFNMGNYNGGVPSIGKSIGLFIVGIAVTFIRCIFLFGFAGYCLKAYGDKNAAVWNIFDGFKRSKKVVGSCLMIFIFIMLWNLLPTVVFLILYLLMMFVSLSFEATAVEGFVRIYMIVDLIWIFYVMLRYIMVPYIVMDRDDVGIMEAIRESKRLMKGNIFKVFTLLISFAGWYFPVALIQAIVITISLALIPYLLVGILMGWLATFVLSAWVNAYVTISLAGFYHMVSSEKADS